MRAEFKLVLCCVYTADAPSDAGFSPTLPPPAPKAELQHEDFNALDFEDSEGTQL